MWPSNAEDFRLLRALGLLAMALLIGVRVVPGLQRHARAILSIALAVYLGGGVLFLLWRATR